MVYGESAYRPPPSPSLLLPLSLTYNSVPHVSFFFSSTGWWFHWVLCGSVGRGCDGGVLGLSVCCKKMLGIYDNAANSAAAAALACTAELCANTFVLNSRSVRAHSRIRVFRVGERCFCCISASIYSM